jgi:ATP-binding cassette subfamily B (MDR/TAP) protein 1
MNKTTNEVQPMNRKSSSFYDYEELKREAEQLRDVDNAQNELKKNLMFEEKDISVFRLYGHLMEKIDYVLIVLATIGSMGAGLSLPIMAYISADLMGDIGNTSEYNDDPLILMDRVKNAFDTQIKRFFVFGAIAFVCNFLGICFWSYVGLRMCHRLKRNYFTVILSQEQGWFDAHNAFEFATKVQAQLEQIEFGTGDKLGQVIQQFSSCIIAFVFAFVISWKIGLIMLCVAPFIIIDVLILVTALKTGIIMGRKTWEKAGGLAEEMLYNIKTVASFANFEFEMRRFNQKVELCYQLDLGTVFRLGACIGALIFFLNLSFVIAIGYGRTLIGKSYNSNKGKDYSAGHVMNSALCMLMGIMGIGLSAPNIKVIQESCTASSD